MVKIRKISTFQYRFSFQEENFDKFYNRFLESDLGKIYQAIPWDELVRVFSIKEHKKGRESIFSTKGKLALMFLKHYASCSDRRLLEQLNGNIEYQFFCDIYLGTDRITNYKIISEIRTMLSKKMKIEKVQQALFSYWSDFIANKSDITTDATCYESEVRLPTNQKLLYESVEWLYQEMKIICKQLKIRKPRTKYNKWKPRYISYSKMRKKSKKKRASLTRGLLRLLDKLNHELDEIEQNYKFEMPQRYYERRKTIRTIYSQQYLLFTTGELPKNRIVSIHKKYLRPIVRGKELKKVEFGAKVNKYQIDGINFIERISFDNFNEGTEFINTIYQSQQLTNTRVKIIGADAIYATNKNRVFVTNNKIKTDFKPKGKPSKYHKQKKQLSGMITKERASRLEGSFGKEKEHYHLKKVKARTELNEKLWIFFGIHTANALEIGRRMVKAKTKAA